MIDRNGYRLNVGIVLVNRHGKLFWGRDLESQGWQFPQGGVQSYETLKETMYRELDEELGIKESDVEVLATTKRWVKYEIPVQMRRRANSIEVIGQKQKWFLLLLTCADSKINLEANSKPEFDLWNWVEYWTPLEEVIYFKRDVYFKVLTEFKTTVELNTNV